jgi:serine/threonine protein kinase
VIHTDLKPKNIMFYRPHPTQNGWVIVDFDSSRRIGEPCVAQTGKYEYIAPELASAHLANQTLLTTPSLDLWGIGRILYFMLTSFPLWPQGTTEVEVLTLLATGKYTLRQDMMDSPSYRVASHLLDKDVASRWRLDKLRV